VRSACRKNPSSQPLTAAGRSPLARILRALLALVVLASGGCATHTDRLIAVRNSFYGGDLDGAQRLLDAQIERGRGDANVLLLEKASVQLAAGQAGEAEQSLRQVRDVFDHLDERNLAETSLSMFGDDQWLSYAGEDYEKVLIRAYLALANLMRGGDDAEAYCLQLVDKQAQIVAAAAQPDGTNPKAVYQQVALAPYLRAALREETHRDFDDVARYREMVVSWLPGFAPGTHDLMRSRTGRHSAPGHGVVYVFALVGRGPFKDEVEELPSTAALMIASAALTLTGNKTLPPVVAPIKVPRVVASPNRISEVSVSVNGMPHGSTATITDVTQMAITQCEANHNHVVARALVRRAVKEATVYAAKRSAGVSEGTWEAVAFELAGLVWQFTESADTRCWGLLPDTIQVLRLELPAGQHEIRFEPLDRNRRIMGSPAARQVIIPDGRNTYVLVNFPGSEPVGQILASTDQ
jgi:uncharacterized protein